MRAEPVPQVYSGYTPEQFQVWSILYARQRRYLDGRAYPAYFADLDRLGFAADHIPRFSELGARLEELTGWRLYGVADFLPPVEYFAFTAEQILPSTSFLRGMDELEHCKRADIFHDLLGHTTLLVQPRYRAYLHALSELAVERIEDVARVNRIANFNKWATEFGLIQTDGGLRAYGAGLLSSSGELEHALAPATPRLPADVQAMLDTPHRRAEFQDQYFVVDGFAWLEAAVPELRATLEREPSTRAPSATP